MTIHIECLHTGPMGVNTYVVSGGNEGECFVVDPADIRPRVLPFLQERGLTCKAVLLTHCHYDHILGVARLQQAGAKVYIGKPDAVGLHDPAFSLGRGIYPVEPCQADVELSGGEQIAPAGIPLRVAATPGHTLGGTCYIYAPDRVIFVGDTIFQENVGRCDLPGGNPATLQASIRRELFDLEGDYKLLPGHGGATMLEHERRYNPYMKLAADQW